MPESCHYLTALHAHSHRCLVSLLLDHPYIPHKNLLFTCQYAYFSSPIEMYGSQTAVKIGCS